MSAPRRKIYAGIAIGGLLILCGLGLRYYLTPLQLPEYNGKTIEQWFYGEQGHPGKRKTIADAEIVFKAMGTNCVPYVLLKAQTRETPMNKIYARLYPKLPEKLKHVLSPPVQATYIQMIAFRHLREFPVSWLEPYANELMEFVPTIKNNQNRSLAFGIVDNVAIRSDNPIAKTDFFLSFLNDSDFRLRFDAVVLLSKINPGLTNGIPTLLTVLTNDTLMRLTYQPPKLLAARYGSMGVDRQIKYVREQAHESLTAVAPHLAGQYEVRALNTDGEPER